MSPSVTWPVMSVKQSVRAKPSSSLIFSYTLLLNARIATNSLAKEPSLHTFENAKTSQGKVLREQMRQLMLTADPGPGVEGPASAIGHQNFDVIMIIKAQ